MTQMVSFSVRDNFTVPNLESRTWYYSKEMIRNVSIAEITSFITLLDRTARTNVILRDESGRFISYKDVVPTAIRDAVASLRPFPIIQ